MLDKCPICLKQAKIHDRNMVSRMLGVDCPRCGVFECIEDLEFIEIPTKDRYKISGYVRNKYENGENIKLNSITHEIILPTILINSNPLEIIDEIIQYIYFRADKKITNTVIFVPENDYPLFYFNDSSELLDYLKRIEKMGYIETEYELSSVKVKLSISAWQKMFDIENTTCTPNQDKEIISNEDEELMYKILKNLESPNSFDIKDDMSNIMLVYNPIAIEEGYASGKFKSLTSGQRLVHLTKLENKGLQFIKMFEKENNIGKSFNHEVEINKLPTQLIPVEFYSRKDFIEAKKNMNLRFRENTFLYLKKKNQFSEDSFTANIYHDEGGKINFHSKVREEYSYFKADENNEYGIFLLSKNSFYEIIDCYTEGNGAVVSLRKLENKNIVSQINNFTMKRDNELIKIILTQLEGVELVNIDNYDQSIIDEHKKIIVHEKYANGFIQKYEDDSFDVIIKDITSKGLEYLTTMRKAQNNKEKYNLPYTIGDNVFNPTATEKIDQSSKDYHKKIFLSYCHKNYNEAEQIDILLSNSNILVTRDKRDLQFTDSIPKFEESIRDHDLSILLISDSYLKSENCMNEVIELLKERQYKNKILPIIVDDAKINNLDYKIEIQEYWKEVLKNLSANIKDKELDIIMSLSNEYRRNKNIEANITEFIDTIKNMMYETYHNSISNKLKEVINRIYK